MSEPAADWREKLRSILVVYVPLAAAGVMFGAEYVWERFSPGSRLDFPRETLFLATATVSAVSAGTAGLFKRGRTFERVQKVFLGAFAGFGVYFLGCCVLALIYFVGRELI